METGELLYRNKNRFSFLLFALIFAGMAWWPVLSSSEVHFSWVEHWPLLFLTTFFVGIGGVSALKTKKTKKFYEYGIGHFKKNKLICFEPYDSFVFVECYHKRTDSGDDRDSHYCLAFWRADASYVELSLKNDRRALKKIWEKISFHCPSLKSRLACYLIDPSSQRLYEFLNQESR